jgi:hypothetical protein
MGDVIIDGLSGANRLVILDANGKIPAFDGSAVTNVAGANFSTGTISVARLDTGATAGKVVKLDGNAKLPAVSGAALTGIVGATQNASDPVIATNPSGGVGTEWQNTTTGEVFVCTDATAGANVWKNVGESSGNVAPIPYLGSRGVFAGHRVYHTDIEYVTIATNGNGTDFGDLTEVASSHGGGSNTTRGIFGYSNTSGNAQSNVMVYITIATPGNATDFGDGTIARQDRGGASNGTRYVQAGGYAAYNQIDYVAISTTGNATDFGDLTIGRQAVCAVSTETRMCFAGGETSG